MINIYSILKGFALSVRALYFRKVNIVGLENVPLDGPVILCGNHANQFIDPIMIASSVNRRISFTIAASSFSKPVVGTMAKALKSIPVKRPEDSKIKGLGKGSIINNTTFKGVETKFIEETNKFESGWSLYYKGRSIAIKKVIDENTIELSANQEISDILNMEDKYFVSKQYCNFFILVYS